VGAVSGVPPRFPEPGEHFARRFRLRSVLGQGGAARVFLADDEKLGNRLSALKVSVDRGEEPSLMGRLQHPHIMPVHTVEYDAESGLRGLCMPYRPGRPLDQVIRRMENVPATNRTARTLIEAAAPEDLSVWPEGTGWQEFPRRGTYPEACAWLALTLAEALAHSHSLGILHRDVKPANVLLCAADGPQLLDFNLAHDPHAPERAESALRGGTLPYMAPEQLEAFRDPDRWDLVGPTADFYALGLVLRELLTGDRPEAPAADIPLPRAINELLAMRADGWPPVRSRNLAVPHALEAVLARCIAHEPARRYASAADLAEDLRTFIRHRPLIHATNPSRHERSRNWAVRNRISLTSLAIIVALATTAFMVTRPTKEDAADFAAQGQVTLYQVERLADGSNEWDDLIEAASQKFNLALRLNPESYMAYRGLGVIAILEGDFHTALTRLSDAIRVAKRMGTTSPYELAKTYVYRAEAELSRFPVNGPQSPESLRKARADLERAIDLLEKWKPKKSRDEADKGVLLAEIDLWSGREYFGRAKLDQSRFSRELLELALTDFEKALGSRVLLPHKAAKADDYVEIIEPILGLDRK
jgi:serine/threonine protein kinase